VTLARLEWDGNDAAGLAAMIRESQPDLGEVHDAVAEIIDEVRRDGDDALFRLEEGLAGARPEAIRVPGEVAATTSGSADVREALEIAAANIRAVAEAGVAADGDAQAELPAGHVVGLSSVPVGSAGAYVPGGAGSYPSTVLMCCIPAQVAGVERIAVVSPTGPGGRPNELVLTACAVAGVGEIYSIGGAQAIAALALGTESVEPVDLIVGPGNRYVQEAKRQLFGKVGIDGIAGPSELMAIVGDNANTDWVALDLCAQAEHSSDGLLVAIAVESAILDRIEERVLAVWRSGGNDSEPSVSLIEVPDTAAGVTLAQALAPEHLELLTEDAEVLAAAVTTAGCVFTGEHGATAFGDYAAGSNHVLPTGGAGRFQGPLGPDVFRRRIATVKMTQGAARELAPTVATLARAEGFPVHAESAEARAEQD
jgi:histidinol dehydrogenase